MQPSPLEVLRNIIRAINTESHPDKLFGLIMDGALELTRAERGFVVLPKGENDIQVAAARNLRKEHLESSQFQVSRGIIRETMTTGMPVVVENASKDDDFAARASVQQMRLASVACVPLRVRGTLIGCLYLDNRFRTGLFGPEALQLLETFADAAALAISSAHRPRLS